MLSVDWLGCLLTGAVLSLLLPGRLRPLRALRAIALGEVGRAGMILLLGGELFSLSVGGLFTRLWLDGLPYPLVYLGGLLLGALLGMVSGPRAIPDMLLYAFCSAVTLLALPS